MTQHPFKSFFHRDTVTGKARPDATREYFEKLSGTYKLNQPDWWYRDTPMGWRVSRLGFGAYRAGHSVRAHGDALREALLSGTNVIDTASNYGDGASEFLIGRVIRDVSDANRLTREQIVVVSKIGYVEGRNLRWLRSARRAYNTPDRIYALGEDRLHGIDPDFLSDQLRLCLRRLGLETLDVLLLHNPEHYLDHQLSLGLPPIEARANFQRAVRAAWVRLEELRSDGLIQYYGLSSNTLAESTDSPRSLSLAELTRGAPSGLRVIQFPANMLESDYRFNRSAGGGPLAEQIREQKFWSLSNRPLNARLADGRLFRLVRMVSPPPDEGASTLAEFTRLLSDVEETEERILSLFQDRFFIFDERTPSLFQIVQGNRDAFEGPQHLLINMNSITRRVQRTVNQLYLLARNDSDRFVLENYARKSNSLLWTWRNYISFQRHERLRGLEHALAESAAEFKDQPLALQAVLFLLAAEVPTTVLCGMRRVDYVRQLRRAYAAPPPPEGSGLNLSFKASDLVDELATPAEV